MVNILLAGVGGQGTVLASKLLAQCAIHQGQPVHTAETIGMAQRGGCVVSHVRIGEGTYSPLIPRGTADVILAFEPAEAVRTLPYLCPGGALVTASAAIKPVTDALADTAYDAAAMLAYLRAQDIQCTVVNSAALCAECGGTKALNVALLGAAAACGALPFDVDALAACIRATLPEKFLPMNLRALALGAAAGGAPR